ncbi:MAG: hypothetical protein C0403_07365 [Desulfobacterium sp.]|nr:hypothetical protein [Desulfobacterium sp.]
MEKSEPGKNTKDSTMDEDEIIELTDLADDDGIIELADIIEPSESNDAIIELIETVDEEDIIELTDSLDLSEDDDEIIELTDALELYETDEDIIELTDSAEALSEEDFSETSDDDDDDDDDDLIELKDIAEEEEIIELSETVEITEQENEDPIDLTETIESEGILIDEEEEIPDDHADADETEKTLDLLDTLESEGIHAISEAEHPIAEKQELSIQPSEGTGNVIDISGYEEIESKDVVFSDHDLEKDLAELNEIAEVMKRGDVEEQSMKPRKEEEDVVAAAAGKRETIILDDQDIMDLEKDLLEPDEEIDIPGEDQTQFDYELENEFSESLGSDLGSVLTVSRHAALDEKEGGKKLDRPGIVTVQVTDKRTKGAPIDFKFESKLHPGDKIIRESDEFLRSEVITKEQVERTIEKVVREMLSEKIDLLLTEMIEKAVSSEIQKIKKALLEDIEVQDL